MAAGASPLVEILTGVGGAGLGALGSWWKMRPEAEGIAVSTLKGVIAELRIELDRKEAEISGLRHRVNELDDVVGHLAAISDEPPGHLA